MKDTQEHIMDDFEQEFYYHAECERFKDKYRWTINEDKFVELIKKYKNII